MKNRHLRKMKRNSPVGFFCGSTANGGLERNLCLLAIEMCRQGIAVTFFLPKHAPYQHLLNKSGVNQVKIPGHRKYLDLVSAWRYARLFKKHNIRQLIFRDNKDLDVLAWCRFLFCPALQLYYWQAMQLGIPKRDPYHTFKFNQLASWVATLNSMKQSVLANTKLNPKKLEVIPVGIRMDRFKDIQVTQAEARATFNIPGDRKTVGVIGRIDPQKGQEFLIHAMADLPDLNLLIVGETTQDEFAGYEQKLHGLIRELKLEDRVFFRPFTDRPELFYKAVDVFVMASDAETFGAVTVESMACGTPVLGTNAGGTPELLGNGKFGYLYTPKDRETFLNKISEMFEDRETVNTKTKRARQNAHNRFSMTASATAFEELLRK